MVVTWCVLRAFATLLVTFWRGRGFGRDKGKDKDRAGLCGLPPLPQEQGHGKDGAPGGLDDFSDIFFMGLALRRTNSIVRFWELITCKVRQILFAGLVVCFVEFSGRCGNWGA